jgi:hypothetical protein
MSRSVLLSSALARIALGACVLVLSAAAPTAVSAATVTETFEYTGLAQTWTVPAGVTSATFDLFGAAGGAFSTSTPAWGGRATATIPVTPGDTIEVYVGGQGRDVLDGFGAGGFNGGTPTGRMTGGGASDVRIGGSTLADRAIVAGGAGGGVSNCSSVGPTGGAGGGLVGGSGRFSQSCYDIFGQQPGSGGTQSAGGTNAGSAAAAGTLGSGGPSVGGGGGGGGGYYGGAGGVSTGGGGGGSSFGPAGTQFETGTRPGNGLVVVSYTTWTVSVSSSGAGTGTVTGGGLDCGGAGHTTCEVTVPDGTQMTLTATEAAGSDFTGFTGGACSTSPCTFTVSADTAVSAAFALEQRALSVTRAGSGSGSVTSGPAGIDCGATCTAPFVYGTSVTLTANPAPESAFDGWSGAGCTGTGTCTVDMTQARSVQAMFRRLIFAPMVTALSPSSGPAGTTVTITGANFGSAREVRFGTQPAAFVVDGHQQITVVVPEGQTGTTDVVVVAAGGTSQPTSASAFTYVQSASVPSDSVPVARRVVCGRIPTLVGRTMRGARATLARDGCAAIRVKRLNQKRKARARIAWQSVGPGTPVFEGDSSSVSVRLR